MAREELEFLISQYVDGTLAEGERVALEARLRDDAEARALLEEERSLTAGLKSLKAVVPAPSVNWDLLAERISASVARGPVLAATEAEEPEAASSYRIGRLRGPARWGLLTLAASVVLAIGGAALWMSNPGGGGQRFADPRDTDDVVPDPGVEHAPTLVIHIPRAEPPPTVTRIVVAGKSQPGRTPDPSIYLADGGIVARTPRISIASGGQVEDNTPGSPY